MGDDPNAAWKNKNKWYSENNHFKGLIRIDGMQTEFEWVIFPSFTTLGILEEIQFFLKGIHCKPEHFNDRIIFLSMYNDIAWGDKKETQKSVFRILLKVRSTLAGSLAVVGHSWDLNQKRNDTGPILINQKEIGTELQT